MKIHILDLKCYLLDGVYIKMKYLKELPCFLLKMMPRHTYLHVFLPNLIGIGAACSKLSRYNPVIAKITVRYKYLKELRMV